MQSSNAIYPWLELARISSELLDRWNLRPSETILGEGDIAGLEHLIHEVAHAVSLGWETFNVETPKKIETHLETLSDNGVSEEERVWAIEWIVWEKLGMTSVFEWGDLEDAAWIQSCELSNIKSLLKTQKDDMQNLANRVIDLLRKLLGKGYQ